MPPSTTLRPRRGVSNQVRRRAATPSTTSDDEDLPPGGGGGGGELLHDENTAESGEDEEEQFPEHDLEAVDEEEDNDEEGEEDEDEEQEDDDNDNEEEEEEEEGSASSEEEPFPPPGLKEISSLASWTVSTAKPGNGVAALRSPDVTQYWQSDGPQPHLLSIHFFKLVSIVRMRIYLDFVSDESYTPTKIQFLAGMGVHDLLEFAEMSFEQPTGWIDVDFSKIGDHQLVGGGGGGDGEWRQPAAPVLRAFLVQVRILENHQNGKDTHLRAVQLFARDDAQPTKRAAPAKAAAATQPRKKYNTASNNITIADWMMDPDIR